MNTQNTNTQNHNTIVQTAPAIAPAASRPPAVAESGSLSPLGERARVRGNSASEVVSDPRIDWAQENVNSKIQNLNSPRRLTGKVARLPLVLRTLVNVMLDEGFTYKAIASKLKELGYPGFLEQNISRWKIRGYQLWLREQQRRHWLPLRLDRGEGRGEVSSCGSAASALTQYPLH